MKVLLFLPLRWILFSCILSLVLTTSRTCLCFLYQFWFKKKEKKKDFVLAYENILLGSLTSAGGLPVKCYLITNITFHKSHLTNLSKSLRSSSTDKKKKKIKCLVPRVYIVDCIIDIIVSRWFGLGGKKMKAALTLKLLQETTTFPFSTNKSSSCVR